MSRFEIEGRSCTAAQQKLQRGIAGFGPMNAALDVACFLVDLYTRMRRRR